MGQGRDDEPIIRTARLGDDPLKEEQGMGVLRLCDQMFEGPVDLEAPSVRTGAPGVYVVICDCKDGKKRMVDAAVSSALDHDLGNPQNHARWREPYDGPLMAYVWYSDDRTAREGLARQIRDRYKPICAREQAGAGSA